MRADKTDVLICGAGIIGLTIARELVMSGHDSVVLIEKEEAAGRHASGRNSGVLHAGIYYAADSLRARTCLAGNKAMKQYCREKEIPLLETGKVIVASNEEELDTLEELYRRALRNGARVELIDEKQLSEIEPNAVTHARALYSHDTAVVDPKRIVESICDDLVTSKKVTVLTGTAFRGLRDSRTAVTTRGAIRFERFINASGAYSDRVAHLFGVGSEYKVLPFRGAYKKIVGPKSSVVKGNIYPVPDMRNPFLGVHFTKAVDGIVYVGPTAMPALGREQYGALHGIGREALSIVLREAVLLRVNREFRYTALAELKKYRGRCFFESARRLLRGLDPHDLEPTDKCGIRPQLVDWAKKRLVTDFLVVRDGTSVHILNSISPGFTSSMEVAKLIVKNPM